MTAQLDSGVPVDIEARGQGDEKKYRGQSPLHRAACNDQVESMQLLVSRKAEVDKRDAEGWTALMCAAVNGPHEQSIKCLLELKASPLLRVLSGTETGKTAGQLARTRGKQ